MARKTETKPEPEPEFKSYAILPAKGGGYVLRTSLVQGETLIANEDQQPDTYTAAVGKLLREIAKVVG